MKSHSLLLGALVGACLSGAAFAADAKSTAVSPDQSIFSAEDDAQTAYEKIQKRRPQSGGDVPFQYACRDFCARFPDDSHYYSIRRTAVSYWAFLGDRVKFRDWDPTDAERDPRLDAEQQADIAMLIANGRAVQAHRHSSDSFDDIQFEAVVAVFPAHRQTEAARRALINAALVAAPEKVVPKFRALASDDPELQRCLRLLESVGQPCEFEFTALDGRKVSSRDYLGKVVLLDFWAKGCGPCLTLMPDLKKMAERLGPSGLAIIGVNMDDNRADAEEIIKKFGLSWPEHFDAGGWKNALAQRFLVTSIPRCVVIDRAGKLRFLTHGPTYQEPARRIEALLAERAPQL